MFKIQTVKSYLEDYTETTNVAKKELNENARPELVEMVGDMYSYDVIYIGYPNWWGTMPMVGGSVGKTDKNIAIWLKNLNQTS